MEVVAARGSGSGHTVVRSRARRAGCFRPRDGGIYVANSTDLVHLSDPDKTGKATKRRVLLTGFGTEDTHHILHTLRWGPDGMLYMNQSVYIHSHIETPYGVRRLGGGGIWQYRPTSGPASGW